MLRPEGYIKKVRRPYPPFYGGVILEGMSTKKYYRPFMVRPYVLKELIKSHQDWYYAKKEIRILAEKILKDWEYKGHLASAKKEFKKKEQQLLQSTTSPLQSFVKALRAYLPSVSLVFVVEDLVEEKIISLLKKKVSSQELHTLLERISTPLEDNYYKREEYDLIRTKNIHAHVKKYIWILSRYGKDISYTVAKAKQKRSKINVREYMLARQKDKEDIGKALRSAKQILGKKHEILVEILQFIVFYRTHRTDILNQASYLYIKKFRQLAKQENISYEDVLHCLPEELLHKIPSRKILHNREKDHVLALEKGKVRCVVGEEMRRIHVLLEVKIHQTNELQGTVANKGKVIGKARIIFSSKNMHKVKEGDILVAPMTTPELMPAMKNAAAFITDEGGITCHAAIISRELDKPCIIGTKTATRIIKDGDLVEVDANLGIIRKL